jgi:hypothetical protein
MNSKIAKNLYLSIKYQFVRNCEEILVRAARDLAQLNRHGISATFISGLALKCEEYQELLGQPQSYQQLSLLETQLRQGLEELRLAAARIWGFHSEKYRGYLLPAPSPQPSMPHAMHGKASPQSNSMKPLN